MASTTPAHVRVLTTLLGAALTLSATAVLAQSATTRPLTPDSDSDVQNAAPSQTLTADEVTVRAAREARHQDIGRDYAGIPVEQVTLTREVGYRDIDIHSPAGITTLRRRIDRTARDACAELTHIYPISSWTSSNQECVETAVNNALSQLPSDVAAAVDSRDRPR
ncbi:MAG TPA: UrcA family protein [Steroidobacteraceae bacterium]|nr:UrcA family protein [Steroidobacteraceae bacterium]